MRFMKSTLFTHCASVRGRRRRRGDEARAGLAAFSRDSRDEPVRDKGLINDDGPWEIASAERSALIASEYRNRCGERAPMNYKWHFSRGRQR